MDQDTTRGKFGFENSSFKNREVDILVGTQMLAGLDFDNVSLVGVMNANVCYTTPPDFRAF
jgi:primosomal protein N' (replication factor Y)